ncbi:hypothetical protein [Suttonella ornithocola]|nr:hypothetical protein [Suttonella ornithocola]
MLDETTAQAETEASDENKAYIELMIKQMNEKAMKRLSHTCEMMYRRIP